MNNDTGVPAFPHWDGPSGNCFNGMTLRDYFAAKWLQGHISNHKTPDLSPSEAAEVAYWVADAFLKERSK